eukprot:jgi/Picre1/34567/NNA_002035.t1
MVTIGVSYIQLEYNAPQYDDCSQQGVPGWSRIEYGVEHHGTSGSVVVPWVHNGSFDGFQVFDQVGHDIPMHQLEHESIKRGDSSLEFIPDQVHVSLWTETGMMVSFATGLGRIGSDTVNPPPQYSEDACGDSLVQYWEADSDAVYLARESNDRVVYSYAYSAPMGLGLWMGIPQLGQCTHRPYCTM